ncbi:DTX3L [Branchiostoma lanceolatum]|uniref:RING-type E3 ubiquitin transferase n=1 Tax=Branchiostoma lanceolatum TaxID=7740 RepID=A0A8K0ETJ8_BRALA|nr:DTX3L [Branchiostoma lanceolatum]
MSQSGESFGSEGASAPEKPRNNNEDDDNRSILVSNIPPTLSVDKVVIHFQKSSSGGGDVKEASCRRLSPSQAKVIFEDVKVIDRVVARTHELAGVTLQVESWSSFLARALEMDRARHRESNCVQRAMVQIHQPVSKAEWDRYEQKISKTNKSLKWSRSTTNDTITLKGSWDDVVEARNLFFDLLKCEVDADKSPVSQDSKETGSRNGQNQAGGGVTNNLEHHEDASSTTSADGSQYHLQAAVNYGTENPDGGQPLDRVDLDRKQREGTSSARPHQERKEKNHGASSSRSTTQISKFNENMVDNLKAFAHSQSSEPREQDGPKEAMECGKQASFQRSRSAPDGNTRPYEEKEQKSDASSRRSTGTTQMTKNTQKWDDNIVRIGGSQSLDSREENLLREARGDERLSSFQRSESAPNGASSASVSGNTKDTRPKQDTTLRPSLTEPSRGVPNSKYSFESKTSRTATLHTETGSAVEESRNGQPMSHSEGGTARSGGTYGLADMSDDEDDVINDSKNGGTVEQPVEPDILSYIMKVHSSKIIAIAERHRVTFSRSEEKSVVYFKGIKKNAEDALEDFITLYQGLFSKLKSITLDASMCDVKLNVCSYAVEIVQKSSPSVFIKNTDGNIIFIGDESEVRSARAEICSILKISESRRRKAHTSSAPTSPTVSGPGQASVTAISADPGGKLVFEDSIKGIRICVVEGDITKQKVDVIVNAANSSLNLSYGVSGAISKAGGSSIQKECDSIIRQRGYLNTTDCVWTRGWRLPCKFVIHAIGPIYNAVYGAHRCQQELHDTCQKVLRMAATDLKAVSIAMPAISSGACGMPRDLCAESMFSAFTDFIENVDPKHNTIVDIRIIDNDRRAAEVFSKVFTKMLATFNFNASKGHATSSNLQPRYPPSGTSYPGTGTTPVSYGSNQTSSGFQTNSGWGQGHQNISGSSFSSSGVASASPPIYPGPTQTYIAASSSSYPHGTSVPTYPHLTQNKSNNGVDMSHTYPGANQTSQPLPPIQQAHSTTSQSMSQLSSPGVASSASSASGNSDKDDECPICLCDFTGPVTTTPCKHKFCADCLKSALKLSGQCPVCKSVIGRLKGNQPRGTMTDRIDYLNTLPGYEYCRSIIEIHYNFPDGVQGPEHPNPGKHYTGTSRTAYLPDTTEGREVLRLLKRAFDSGLVFTIGTSVTTGQTDTVVWNDIHHKTSKYGGPNSYGYPDPQYLTRVKEELAAKGIK